MLYRDSKLTIQFQCLPHRDLVSTSTDGATLHHHWLVLKFIIISHCKNSFLCCFQAYFASLKVHRNTFSSLKGVLLIHILVSVQICEVICSYFYVSFFRGQISRSAGRSRLVLAVFGTALFLRFLLLMISSFSFFFFVSWVISLQITLLTERNMANKGFRLVYI